MTKCTCGHDKDIHFKGVSTCLNHGRCLCALYTPVDPSADVKEVAHEWIRHRTYNLDVATWTLVEEAFIAGWNAKEARL